MLNRDVSILEHICKKFLNNQKLFLFSKCKSCHYTTL